MVHAFADPQIGNIALVKGSNSFYVTFSDSQKTYISEIGMNGTVLRSTTPISYDGLPASHYEFFQVEPISDDVLFAAFSESSTHGLGTFGKFIKTTDFSDLEPAPSWDDAEKTLSPSQIINNDDGSISLAVGSGSDGVEIKALAFDVASEEIETAENSIEIVTLDVSELPALSEEYTALTLTANGAIRTHEFSPTHSQEYIDDAFSSYIRAWNDDFDAGSYTKFIWFAISQYDNAQTIIVITAADHNGITQFNLVGSTE